MTFCHWLPFIIFYYWTRLSNDTFLSLIALDHFLLLSYQVFQSDQVLWSRHFFPDNSNYWTRFSKETFLYLIALDNFFFVIVPGFSMTHFSPWSPSCRSFFLFLDQVFGWDIFVLDCPGNFFYYQTRFSNEKFLSLIALDNAFL